VQDGNDKDDEVEADAIAGNSKLVTNKPPNKKTKKRSMHMSAIGVEYPPFPRRVVKKLAGQYSGGKISNETLKALETATDAFFEKVSEGLGDLYVIWLPFVRMPPTLVVRLSMMPMHSCFSKRMFFFASFPYSYLT
jgi:hypothetical protein